jgi:hypothetical protein
MFTYEVGWELEEQTGKFPSGRNVMKNMPCYSALLF